MGRFTMVGLFLLAALAASNGLLDGPGAGAQEIPGATYKGSHSGGGTFTLTVPAEGEIFWGFAVTDVPCDGAIVGYAAFSQPDVEIDTSVDPPRFTVETAFMGPTGVEITFMTVTGSFSSPGYAEGTLEYHGDVPSAPECSSGILTWTATTTAAAPTPAPPTATPSAPECPPDSECAPLVGEVCQFATWSGEDDTTPAELAAMVRPAENLKTLWAQQPVPEWKGYSPEFPEAGDMEPVDQLDVVAICMAGPGEFVRPLI